MTQGSEVEILLVEDNPNDAEIALRALKKSKLTNTVVHVCDGEEALDFIYARGKFSGNAGKKLPKIVLLDDGDDTPAVRLAAELGLAARRDKIPSAQDRVALASAWPEDAALAQEWTRWAEAGGTLVLYDLEPCALPLPGGAVEIKRSGFWSALFASRATGHPMVADFGPDDFRYWFDARAGRIEPFLPTAILAPAGWRAILATGFCEWGLPSQPAHAACEQVVGAGRVVLCQLQLEGRTKANPPALKFARRILHP